MDADIKGCLNQINKSYKAFEHKGKRMSKAQVKAVLQYKDHLKNNKMDTHNDNNLNRNNPHSIYATEEESLSDLEIAQNDCSEYQMKYMAEKAKIEAIKEVIKFGRSIESENGTTTMLLNKLENIINLK